MSDNSIVLLDWLNQQSHNGYSNVFENTPVSRASELIKFLDPLSREYTCSVPTTFLFARERIHELNCASSWIIRDGLIPLLWFFRRHPTPEEFSCRLFLREDLASLAPPEWRKQMGEYRFGLLPSKFRRAIAAPSVPLRRLILCGVNSESVFQLKDLTSTLDELERRYAAMGGREIDEVIALLPFRDETLGAMEQSVKSANLIRELTLRYGGRLKFVAFSTLSHEYDFRDCGVAELNNGRIVADNFVLHYLTGRGARLLSEPLSDNYENYASAGLEYGFGLNVEKIALPEVAAEAVGDALYSVSNTRFAWSALFQDEPTPELEISGVTRYPHYLLKQGQKIFVSPMGDSGNVDGFRETNQDWIVSGWLIDRAGRSGVKSLRVYQGSRFIPSRFVRRVRSDIVVDGKRDGAFFESGFDLWISKAPTQSSSEPIWIVAEGEGPMARLVGAYRVASDESVTLSPGIRIESAELSWERRGSALIATESSSGRIIRVLDDFTGSAPHLLERAGLTGHLDSVERVEDGWRVQGWAAKTIQQIPPEAAVIFARGRSVAVSRCTIPRQDILKQFGPRVEYCSFSVTVPFTKCPADFKASDFSVAFVFDDDSFYEVGEQLAPTSSK